MYRNIACVQFNYQAVPCQMITVVLLVGVVRGGACNYVKYACNKGNFRC